MITVGTQLFGFCGGFFGRDSYGDKVVEAVGSDWVVVRNLATRNAEFGQIRVGSWPKSLEELEDFSNRSLRLADEDDLLADGE